MPSMREMVITEDLKWESSEQAHWWLLEHITMAYVENKVKRWHASEIWGTGPAVLMIHSTGPGGPMAVFSEVGSETDRLEKCFKRQNAVDAVGWNGRESPGRDGRRVPGNEKELMQPRKEQEITC